MLSDPVNVGVPISEDEIHLRWLLPNISKRSEDPITNHELVKLAKLLDIVAGALDSQSNTTLSDSSSMWSTRLRHDAEFPVMMLFSSEEAVWPEASHSKPPLSPLMSKPRTNPSTSSNSIAWPLEFATILRSSMIIVP